MDHLHILWTSGQVETARKMVFMYGKNSLLRGWWDRVTIIIWGAATQLAAENELIQDGLRDLRETGVELLACRACAEQLKVVDELEQLGVKVIYTGELMTRLLKDNEKLLTV
ncbi:MAG: DsrE family protein [Deltaproteobacteria bacterium]|nr:MAG: DsrE family protein [Deltaproteobacteria bacterium]